MNSNMILKETIHLKNLRSYGALCCSGGLVTRRCPTLATPWTVALQTPLSMGFSRQAYCSGLPFPTPGYLPSPGIRLASLVSPTPAGGIFTTTATLEAHSVL